MSQYSISLRAYIHMHDKYKNNSATFADYAKKVIYARSLFFSFDYAGDAEFKKLFEESFVNKYFDCDVAYEDINRFLFKLKTDTQRKAPVYYNMWKIVKEKENLLLTSSGFDKATESATEHGNNTNNETYNGTEQSDSVGTSSNESTANSNNKSTGSQFPANIEHADDFDDIRYMDSGSRSDSESGATSSGETSSASSSISNNNRSGTSSSDINRNNERFSEYEHNGDFLQKIAEFQRTQADIIESFVNSFNNLFCLIW